MSVLIKGMKMPKNCWECPCDYGAFGECVCGLTEQSTKEFCKNRRDDCLLVEVPPHGRLIDADALFETMERTGWYDNADRDIAEDLVLAAPTIIDAEEGE